MLNVSNNNFEYFRQRFLFYRNSCIYRIRVLVINYDAEVVNEQKLKEATDWGVTRLYLDYNQLLRIPQKNNSSDKLLKAKSYLRILASSLINVADYVFAYMPHGMPLVKLFIEEILRQRRDSIFVELEDGLGNYMSHMYPDLFPQKNPFVEKSFRLFGDDKLFSLHPPDISIAQYKFALFYPELIVRKYSDQIDVLDFFCFSCLSKNMINEYSALVLPNNYDEILVQVEFLKNIGVERDILVSLHPRQFEYSGGFASMDNVLEGFDRDDGVLVIAPANDVCIRLVERLKEAVSEEKKQIILVDKVSRLDQGIFGYDDIDYKKVVDVFIFSPNYAEEILGEFIQRGVSVDCMKILTKHSIEKMSRFLNHVTNKKKDGIGNDILGERPISDYSEFTSITYYSPTVPVEYLVMENKVIIGFITSALYRMQRLGTNVKAIALLDLKTHSYGFMEYKMSFTLRQQEAIASIFRSMGVEVKHLVY